MVKPRATLVLQAPWLRGPVGGTTVSGRRAFAVLHSACS